MTLSIISKALRHIGGGRSRRRPSSRPSPPAIERLETRQLLTLAAPVMLNVPGQGLDTTPTLSWSEVDGADHYGLWVNNLTTGQRQVIREQNLGQLFFVPGSPLDTGRYRAWSQAFDTLGNSSRWSRPVTFRVRPDTPDLAVTADIFPDGRPQFTWDAVSNANTYDLWVRNLTTGESMVLREPSLTGTSFSPATPLADGVYRAWLRSLSGGENSPWSAPIQFTVDGSRLATPEMISPSPTVNSTRPEFEWTSVDGAVSYDLWVNNNTTGQRQVIRQKQLNGNSWTPADELSNGEYSAWIQAQSASGQTSRWSPRLRFSVDTTLPNVVVILTDDMGYGDIGIHGAQGFETPHIDRLASEGMQFTDFYTVSPICTAARAALMTGSYATRVGLDTVLPTPDSRGLNFDETTLAEVLEQSEYATAAFGKWHLGTHPTRHGFDQWYTVSQSDYPDLPTKSVTEGTLDFIEDNADTPFFAYVSHFMPHVPLTTAPEWEGSSEQGAYGDVIQEIDASVGSIVDLIDQMGLGDNTLIMFTSDNGPALNYGNHGGSSGPFREGKSTTFEGGVRVPGIFRWTGTIPAGAVSEEVVTTMDLLPTLARLTDAEPPANKIDGKDVWPLLAGEAGAESPHEEIFFYRRDELQAVRSGPWKLHVPHSYSTILGEPGSDGVPVTWDVAEIGLSLFNLDTDIGETTNVADENPGVVEDLLARIEAMRLELGDAITGVEGAENRLPSFRHPPRTPVLLSPTGTTTDATPTVHWQKASGAAWYEVWIQHEDDRDNTPIILEKNVRATNYTVTTPLAAGTYNVWVRGVGNNRRTGPWSDRMTFTIADAV